MRVDMKRTFCIWLSVLAFLILIPSTVSAASSVTTPDGSKQYVANGNDISVIDTTTNAVIATINLASSLFPYSCVADSRSVAVTPDGSKVYVTCTNGFICSIDTTTDTVITAIRIGICPFEIAISPDGTRAYVSDADFRAIYVIDTVSEEYITSIIVGITPVGVAITPDGSKVYVACSFCGDYNDRGGVYVIDTKTNTVLKEITSNNIYDTGSSFMYITISGNRAYVDGGKIIIDTTTDTIIDPNVKIPEFPSVALPMAAVLGLLVFFGWKEND